MNVNKISVFALNPVVVLTLSAVSNAFVHADSSLTKPEHTASTLMNALMMENVPKVGKYIILITAN